MRNNTGLEDFALPALLVCAIVFAIVFARATFAIPALAAPEAQSDYTMTITADRLPAECKGRTTARCERLAGRANVEMRENRPRLADDRAPLAGLGSRL